MYPVMKSFNLLSVLLFAVNGIRAQTAARGGPTCREIVIPVTIKAKNIVIPINGLASLNIGNILGGLVTTLFSTVQPVQGTFNIAGRYCEPQVAIAKRKDTLQLLVHPATYDRNYWSGGDYPGFGWDGDRYSWVVFASKEGYPTFAFDRLGNGNSSHPDPVTVVQCPAQAETIFELIKLLKSSKAKSLGFPRSFKRFIFVGSSLGSIVGNVLNVLHPEVCDAMILGGFSQSWLLAVPGFVAKASLLPAPGLPIGYLQATSPAGVAYLLFYGPGQHYDPGFIAQDYARRGTVSVGEGASGSTGISVASKYSKPVLLINGEQDVLFCGTTALDGRPGNCRNGITDQTKSLYPVAQYSYILVPNSGHCWHHQYNALNGFDASHKWLAGKGF